jgi:hypothetical protein
MENIAWGLFFFELKIYYKICKKSSRAPKKSFAGTSVPAGIRLAITAVEADGSVIRLVGLFTFYYQSRIYNDTVNVASYLVVVNVIM